MTDRLVLTDPGMTPAPQASIAAGLEQARAAHQRYRDSVPRRVAQGTTTIVVPGDADAAGEALNEACRLFADAHARDRSHLDPAWRPEDDALLEFYAEQLSR